MTGQSPESSDVAEVAEVRHLLERGFGTEPPTRITRDDLIVRGRRRLRKQRAAAVAGVALAAVAVLTIASVTTSGWFGSEQVGPATGSTTAPISTKPASPKDRLSEALRTAPVQWPAEITKRTGDAGSHWYSFRYGFVPSADSTGYEASMRLDTPTGYRWLTIDVVTVAAAEHAPQCIGAQSKKPLPDCTRTQLPDGREMRVDIEKSANPGFPTIALITVVQPNRTKVEVMETASVGDGSRVSQLLPTSELIRLASLPGLTLG